MQRIFIWFNKLSKHTKDSLYIALAIIGLISTFMSIIGISLGDYIDSIWISVGITLVIYIVVTMLVYWAIGMIFEKEVNLVINHTPVCISMGDIFNVPGWKVIGCDSCFDLRVDDVVIAKKSLHGQVVVNHASEDELRKRISDEATRLRIEMDENGLYKFPLGTIIPYESSVDGEKYLLLALNNLNEQYEAHTNMAEYEHTLMKMWRELSRVYSMNDIVIPLLGAGIPRFDDGPKENTNLLRCMLCTLKSSGVNFKAVVKIVLFGDAKSYSLYEYKNMFN